MDLSTLILRSTSILKLNKRTNYMGEGGLANLKKNILL